MKQALTLLGFILLACATGSKNDNMGSLGEQPTSDTMKEKYVSRDSVVQLEKAKTHLASTYDYYTKDNDYLLQQKEELRELSETGVFNKIHSVLMLVLVKKHHDYFKTNSKYDLLSFAHGDLFQVKGDDFVFTVYDKSSNRIAILVYNNKVDSYLELYREIGVEDGLESAECNYGATGTLDYQIANELIYQKEYLRQNPERYIEYEKLKIADITNDEDIILEEGCFSKVYSTANSLNSLCISTSSVYNNWDCVIYDKERDIFVVHYGQAFAD